MTDEPTLGELGRRMDEGFDRIDQRFERVEAKQDDQAAVMQTLARHDERLGGHDREIAEIKKARVADAQTDRTQRQNSTANGIARLSAWSGWVVGVAGLAYAVFGK